jgi:Lon protease-like protein
MPKGTLLRLPVFPLAGAVLFPRAQIPLHIFEPRYRTMVRDALAGDRLIGMVQPRDEREPPTLFEVVLDGLSRFRIAREAEVETPYRQVDASRDGFGDEEEADPLGLAQRAELEREAKLYADALGYDVDWTAVQRIDDETLVNGIAQIAPLDVGSKQALLEASGLDTRADLLVQFMQFQRMAPGGAEGPETLQ